MTKYNKSVREGVFQLYATGTPIERIMRQTGISKTTIHRWIERYDWAPRSKEIEKKVMGQVNETVAEIRKRQNLIIAGVMARFANRLKSKDFRVTTSEMLAVMKHELILVGEPETQENEDRGITAKKIADIYEKLYGEENGIEQS